ncbi:hypothetical protein MTR_3g453020 [Medicago truncatula]|uniref:Uncharacterized protein n=1 Tax=Medicago truncatula TaxID=3880 RepID=A0A072V6L6_MEDTR|nr:hypothetical protein MTR_3g453020 [Medicago truncatula]
MDEESMGHQYSMNSHHSVGVIDTTIKPSQGNKLEVSILEKIEATTLSTILETKNKPTMQLVAPKQKELKSLMDSSSDLDHLISNQESKSKLISLFNQLKQHHGLLPSHMKEFIEKVQTFNDYIIKYATFQQVLKKLNQLLDSKTI